jgi:large subunit ribosomal protein L4
MTTTKTTISMEASVYDREGKKSGSFTLPEQIFALPWNADLVHQVVVAMAANARQGNAHAKDRSEVRGGGKKPWAQKGTGRARHGSSRSPIWRHGGVTFGPRNDKDYSQKLPRKMKAKALWTTLSRKYKDGELLLVDKLSYAAPKTKEARVMLDKLGTIGGYEGVATRRKNAILFVLPEQDAAVKKSFANFGNVRVGTVRSINAADVLTYKYLVVVGPEVSMNVILSKLA